MMYDEVFVFDESEGWAPEGEYEIDGAKFRLIHDTTPNQSGWLDASRGVGIVEHYTAHRSAHGAQAWLDDRRARASAHFIVGDADELVIYQTASLFKRTWHAGDGRLMGRNPNDFCWGIEHSNAGLLKRKGGRYETWYGAPVPEAEVVHGADHKGTQGAWDDYDAETIAMSVALHRALAAFVEAKQYQFLDCWPHSDAAPHRKVDTGPAFPLAMFRAIMGGRAHTQPETQRRKHTVAPGDTLWGLYRTYGVSVDRIVQANSIKNPDKVPIGTVLVIPN